MEHLQKFFSLRSAERRFLSFLSSNKKRHCSPAISNHRFLNICFVLFSKVRTMSTPADERNIEIKARVGSDTEFESRVEIAKKLTSTDGQLIVQRDVFFNSLTGRLKLRYLKDSKSQLVYYDRPDVAGPKLSKYNKIEIDEPEVLEKILTASNGARGILQKQRYLFIYKNTRIHMDKVENLGNFMEFEVCLQPEQSIEEGQAFAEELMETFKIKNEDLMTGAYFDELNK